MLLRQRLIHINYLVQVHTAQLAFKLLQKVPTLQNKINLYRTEVFFYILAIFLPCICHLAKIDKDLRFVWKAQKNSSCGNYFYVMRIYFKFIWNKIVRCQCKYTCWHLCIQPFWIQRQKENYIFFISRKYCVLKNSSPWSFCLLGNFTHPWVLVHHPLRTQLGVTTGKQIPVRQCFDCDNSSVLQHPGLHAGSFLIGQLIISPFTWKSIKPEMSIFRNQMFFSSSTWYLNKGEIFFKCLRNIFDI